MSDLAEVVHAFESRVRQRLPSLAEALRGGAPDGHGNNLLLEAPWPSDPKRGVLRVLYYPGDCFEISFSVTETRGPAELQIPLSLAPDLAGAAGAVVDYLGDFTSGHRVVQIHRYRFLWFQPYYLPFFGEQLPSRRGHIVETLRWAGAPSGPGSDPAQETVR